jgi:SH3-like domain-containing protein
MGFSRIASSMGGVVCVVLGSSSAIFSSYRQLGLRRIVPPRRFPRFAVLAALSICWIAGLGGCSRFKPKPPAQYVYVTAKQTYLRDRVAAVSNRTATVENGDKLEVLEHGRRFVRVQTAKGEQGWIDEKVVATQEIFDQFDALKQSHKDDPEVASAVVRDEVYMHAAPGRDTERFYRLAEGEKLKLITRATITKPVPPGTRVAKAPPPVVAKGAKPAAPPAPDVPPPPVMEDWWLVRDSKGDTGWLYSRMMDVDAPDAITRYAEGQRIVGAYILTTVNDPEAEQTDKNIPIYVTVMSPYKAGLTYDFDQVRVFTWNVKMHRYETAFREHGVEGYLPVKLSNSPTDHVPTFTYYVLPADVPTPVPDANGELKPARTIAKTYRLENNICRRVLPPGMQPPAQAKPPEEPKTAVKKKK